MKMLGFFVFALTPLSSMLYIKVVLQLYLKEISQMDQLPQIEEKRNFQCTHEGCDNAVFSSKRALKTHVVRKHKKKFEETDCQMTSKKARPSQASLSSKRKLKKALSNKEKISSDEIKKLASEQKDVRVTLRFPVEIVIDADFSSVRIEEVSSSPQEIDLR